jgi:hypothetical protein
MVMVKKLLLWALGGAALGDIVGTLVARSFIPWYESPGEAMQCAQQLCNLAIVTRATIDKVVRYQIASAAVGALLFLVAGGLLMRALGRRSGAGTASTAV